MTVYDWLASFQLGEEKEIPSNCTFNDLKDEALARFGYKLVKTADNKVKRVCPHCGR